MLSTALDAKSDVVAMEYHITPVACDDDNENNFAAAGSLNYEKGDNEPIGEKMVVKKGLKELTLPGGIPTFENKPFDAHSDHHFADMLKLLPVGCYDVDVYPLKEGKKQKKGYKKYERSDQCMSVHRDGVEVVSGKTTEILLISQCEGLKTGLLDVIAALNHPPYMVDFEIIPNKFVECPSTDKPTDVKVCARATDPDGDPMKMKWSQVKGPEALGFDVMSFPQAGDTLTECVKISLRKLKDGEKDYQFKVTVFDQFHKKKGGLITAEKWYLKNHYGNVKSRTSQKFPIYLSCVEEPKKKRYCPANHYYWKKHNKYASMPKDIAWPTSRFTHDPSEKGQMCGKSWLKTMKTDAGDSVYYDLAQQYIAARLNQANGAYMSPFVRYHLFSAHSLLWMCKKIDNNYKLRKVAKQIAEVLRKYNEGHYKAPKCNELNGGDNSIE